MFELMPVILSQIGSLLSRVPATMAFSTMAFAESQKNNKHVGKTIVRNGCAWLLESDGWRPTASNFFKPNALMPSPPALPWSSRFTAPSDRTLRYGAVADAQRDTKLQANIEANSFDVQMELGKFDSGLYFIWVHFTDGDMEKISVTPPFVDRGTRFQACPKHISLGHVTTDNEPALQDMVKGSFNIKLKKWSKRLDSSTYLFDNEFKDHLDEVGARFGFRPAGEWHISL